MLVRSGAFEVDLAARQLRPCYWPAARHRVLRGTWFAEKGGEWVPLKASAPRGRGGEARAARRRALLDAAVLRHPGMPPLHAAWLCIPFPRPTHLHAGPPHPQESLAEQLEEGYRQAIWLPARGRLAEQPGGGAAARLELSSHVDKGLYALFASGAGRLQACVGWTVLAWAMQPHAAP